LKQTLRSGRRLSSLQGCAEMPKVGSSGLGMRQ